MRHATLRQLKVFESVARNLSFSRAAEELHLTQPAVSIQVKKLEEHAGLPLFEQLGKKDLSDTRWLRNASIKPHHHSAVSGDRRGHDPFQGHLRWQAQCGSDQCRGLFLPEVAG